MARISILFPVFNGAHFLRETLNTVVSQTFNNWELIAQDGGSNDNTVEILKEYSVKYPNIRVFSEKDEGPYHAIMKAAEKARGEFIYLLCSGDGYLDKRWLEQCTQVMDADSEVSLVWGIPYEMDASGGLKPSFMFAHFLKGKFSRRAVLGRILSKLAHPVEFIKKINSVSVRAVKNMLTAGDIPQKQAWFNHWLNVGTVFPDGNMCMSRKVFFDFFPKYRLGTRETGNYMAFYYDFNAKGYLAHGIAAAANFARLSHANQVSVKAKKYNDALTIEYFKKIEALRRQIERKEKEVVFHDRTGSPIQ